MVKGNKAVNVFEWIDVLEGAKIHFSIIRVRADAIMLQASVPGERWEIECFRDGSVEFERFVSGGRIDSEELLRTEIARHKD